jgi:hypothetical protein
MITALADQLQLLIEPRYVTSVEERVFVEGPQRRIPDLWVKKSAASRAGLAVATPRTKAVVIEVETLEVREGRIEILDASAGLKLVTVIELVSPTNKTRGPGRRSYRQKQKEFLRSDCHLVEIDLHRTGRHTLAVPHWRVLQEVPAYEYLASVSRAESRQRFELYPMRLREPLDTIDMLIEAAGRLVAVRALVEVNRGSVAGSSANAVPVAPEVFPMALSIRLSATEKPKTALR